MATSRPRVNNFSLELVSIHLYIGLHGSWLSKHTQTRYLLISLSMESKRALELVVTTAISQSQNHAKIDHET